MISVAIVTASRSLRNRWQSAVESMPNAKCIGSSSTPNAFLQPKASFCPDVVLLGLETEDDGLSLIQLIVDQFPNTSILILASRIKDDQLFAALRAGVNGYLEQKVFPSILQKAILELHQGGAPLSKVASQRILASFRAHRSSDNLSEREQEVYSLLCEGKNYREIGEKLFVSSNTVRFHIKNIYKKLGVKSRHEAMRLAYDIGER